jgi:glycine betaine/L-proline transport ATP binding subunit
MIMMNKIEIKDLCLVFGKNKGKAFKLLAKGKAKQEIMKESGCIVAVNNVNLNIEEGEIFVIMGLSGSGKSTLLRCINRLIHCTSGEVLINGEDIARVSDKELQQIRRKTLAMVFQNFGLLPHRSVLHNIAFGLELQGIKKKERESIALEAMQQVGLEGYGSKMVSELSGGMQQRVGLARALANNPEILLMDEAFSALDPLIRVQMQNELLALQTKMKKTIVFITHDLSEAVKLGDRIAIMKDGEIVQVGTPEEILTDPANKYVKRFVENVDRTKVITAASIMMENPVSAHLQKETPDELVQKMRELKIGVMPIVNDTQTLVGEVRLSDLIKLDKEGKKVINPAVRPEVHSVLSDTILEDILPLLTHTNSPIWVVDEQRKFLGIIPLSLLIAETTGKNKAEINEIIQNAIDL